MVAVDVHCEERLPDSGAQFAGFERAADDEIEDVVEGAVDLEVDRKCPLRVVAAPESPAGPGEEMVEVGSELFVAVETGLLRIPQHLPGHLRAVFFEQVIDNHRFGDVPGAGVEFDAGRIGAPTQLERPVFDEPAELGDVFAGAAQSVVHVPDPALRGRGTAEDDLLELESFRGERIRVIELSDRPQQRRFGFGVQFHIPLRVSGIR